MASVWFKVQPKWEPVFLAMRAKTSEQIWQLWPAAQCLMSDTEALSQYVVAGVLKEKEASIEIRKS